MGPPAPNTLELVIGGPIERADLPGLFDRVCALLQASEAQLLLCNVGGVAAEVAVWGRLA